MEDVVKIERDRAATEKRLLDTIGKMIAERGFEKIGINAVSAQSGVSKILIYRYFGTVEGLIVAYIRQYDFWINFPRKLPGREKLADFLKKMFRKQIQQLRNDPILRRLYRWELSTNNAMIDELRQQREETGVWLIDAVSKITGSDQREVAGLATIITSSIDYLAMFEDFCPKYNGISLDKNEGWEQIGSTIDGLIDQWLGQSTNRLTKVVKIVKLQTVSLK
jgi:AcrR family transcriptional regulator